MMCSTLVEAAAATGRADWAEAADRIATFLLDHLRRADGRVLRSWCRGRASLPGYAADYAWLVDCLTRLGELTGDPRWTAESVGVARQLLALFADDEGGGLFTNGVDVPPLVVRPRDNYDGVTPAAGSVAAIALARLGALVGSAELEQAAARIVEAAGAAPASAPSAFPELLLGAALLEHGPVEIVVTGDRADLLQAARRRFLPGAVLAWRSSESAEIAAIAVDGEVPEPASPLLEGRRGRLRLRLPARGVPGSRRQRRRSVGRARRHDRGPLRPRQRKDPAAAPPATGGGSCRPARPGDPMPAARAGHGMGGGRCRNRCPGPQPRLGLADAGNDGGRWRRHVRERPRTRSPRRHPGARHR